MQYLLLIYSNEAEGAAMSEAAQAQLIGDYQQYTADLVKSGALRAGDALQPTSTATTVRVRNGDPVTTDGPFAETKEALGGYYLIEVDNLDEALKWAAKIPTAKYGSVEVRPIMKFD